MVKTVTYITVAAPKLRRQVSLPNPMHKTLMADKLSWKSAMLRIVAGMPEQFTLADVLAHSSELARLFPQNRHVGAKIRQTLQILRDQGVLEFLGRGQYRRLEMTPKFSCLLDMTVAEGYTSRSQVARIVIETWAALNLYCLHCEADDLSALPPNSEVSDLMCAHCDATYQVKSKEGRFGDTVLGANYDKYYAAANEHRFPHLLLVEWDARFSAVFVARAIRGDTVTPTRIIARKALASTARRAGWRGCTIDVSGLSAVDLVVPDLRTKAETRKDWSSL